MSSNKHALTKLATPKETEICTQQTRVSCGLLGDEGEGYSFSNMLVICFSFIRSTGLIKLMLVCFLKFDQICVKVANVMLKIFVKTVDTEVFKQ